MQLLFASDIFVVTQIVCFFRLDGRKLKDLGFTMDVPAPTADHFKEIIQNYVEMKIFPHTLAPWACILEMLLVICLYLLCTYHLFLNWDWMLFWEKVLNYGIQNNKRNYVIYFGKD